MYFFFYSDKVVKGKL